MKLSIGRIKELYKASALDTETDKPIQAKYYARPLSYRIAWVAIKMGINPNHITVLALTIDAVGCLFIGLNHFVLGALCLNVGHVLDYVDGTVARATNTVSDFGKYFDSICDEVVEVIIPVSLGVGLYIGNCTFIGLSPLAYLVSGFVYAIAHLLGTISLLHIKDIRKTAPRLLYVSGGRGIRRWLYETGINVKSSAVIILLLLAVIPNGMPIFVLAYTMLAISELLMSFYTMVVNR